MFIKQTFRKLKNGVLYLRQILSREDWQFVESDKKYIYCGTEIIFHREYILPRSLQIKAEWRT